MRLNGWRAPVVAALAAAAVLGIAGPAVAMKRGSTESAASNSEQLAWMPQEVWQVIAGYLPPDIQAMMRMRDVSFIHRNAVDAYMAHNPRVWRLLPTATLERLLASPDAPPAWKTTITTTVLVPDVAPEHGTGKYDRRGEQAARVVQDQQELDVALADPAVRTINIVGDGKLHAGNVTRDHKLRLHNSVQVENFTAGTVVAYDRSHVRNLTCDYPHLFVGANGQIQIVLHVVAFDQAQVHGITEGYVTSMDQSEVHSFSGGTVQGSKQTKIYGVTGGLVEAGGQAEVHDPTGGRIICYGPDARVINPGPGVNVEHRP
ncbi:MAG: hypothetical protein H0T78_09145 [Longispora sp.]|nr:hypothetical protein [Longispora sp. (in: high G+C Gram-positive bacteria)]